MATKRQVANSRSSPFAAYSMRQNGYTTNEIALALGYQPNQVKSAVQRGERLNSLKED